jgi:hypothetical protein
MRRSQSLVFFLILLFLPTYFHAQLWSKVLGSSRAVDWSKPGVQGGIPTNRTQCGSTIAAYTGSATTINTALQNCGANQYVQLGAGTFHLSNGITFSAQSNITLRGEGADQTFLIFSGNFNCLGLGSVICVGRNNIPQMPTPNTTTSWTAGYAVGTTTITVGTTSGMAVGNTLILDQLDDSSDTGNIYICATKLCTGQGGNAYGRTGRAQQQLVMVTGINGNQVTISPGLYMPNWRSSQNPGLSWTNDNISKDGVEDLSIDGTNDGINVGGNIVFLGASESWVKGVRSLGGARNHIWLYQSLNNTVRDSYFYGSQTSGSESYGIESFSSSGDLIENNIFQHVTAPIVVNGSDSGSVFGYNFAIDDSYTANGSSPGWMDPSNIQHEAGIAMNLSEGNDGLGFEGDNIHGTHHFQTLFRNFYYGDIWNNPPKNNNTSVVHLWAFTRYYNLIGNVIGQTGYYNTYEADLTNSATAVYSLGAADGESSSPNDPLTKSTLMRWGNYDSVNAANRFVASEVPSGLSLYANPLPASNSLPPSFYLSAQPSWWGSMPWPPIGPDVTGGNLPGVNGHAYMIPARNCWLNVMGGKIGTSGALSFNAGNCYAAGAQQVSPPSGLTAIVN